MTYEPELGQALWGQPHKEHECPYILEASIAVLGALIKEQFGENPTDNSGGRFECSEFSMHAYSWGDEEQPWNFKCGEVEVSWYKYLCRGTTCNDAGLNADIPQLLMKCVAAIKSGRVI